MTIAPPFPYSGGKQSIAADIAALFPPHGHYVEPFCGGLSVLLAKVPAPIETVNDLNRNLMSFWKVLRDRPGDLERVCALTPHSRAEYRDSHDTDVDDELEKARRVFVQLSQSRGSRTSGTGWRFVHGTNRLALARYIDGYMRRIAPAAERLRSVSLECRDALDVIRAYARPDALLYVDPPYLSETRYGTQYEHEFATEAQHAELLDLLLAVPSMVAISGYDSGLYRERLAGWHRHEFKDINMNGCSRTEVLWCNFEPPLALFGGVA